MSYQGSQLLKFIADPIGLPIDRLNFLVVQLVALISGLAFRYYLKPCPKNTLRRHLVTFLWGFALANFCYGGQVWHLFMQAFLCYVTLIVCPRQHVQIVIFVISMGYLSGLHIYRMIVDYGGYNLDITGAMMVLTQKLTSLGFAYYDGMKSESLLSADQKTQVIKDCPHIIEFLSYTFNFQGVIVGPLVYYRDYIDFITGNNILKHKKPGQNESEDSSIIVQPSVTVPVLKKLFYTLLIGIVYFQVAQRFTVQSNMTPEMVGQSLWYRFVYFYVSISSQRSRYYFAWMLSEAMNNASGLGFNGYDANGNPKWDLCKNMNLIGLETSTSMKTVFDNWNIQTQLWFRRIAYDRLSTGKTLGVFVLSAFWHGFYPGYYLTFVLCAFTVYTGRGIRRKIRPYFQTSKPLKVFYDIFTWVCTIFCINYSAVSFDLFEVNKSIQFYNQWYWCVHIIVLIIPFALPGASTKAPKKTLASVSAAEESKDEKTVISEAADSDIKKRD